MFQLTNRCLMCGNVGHLLGKHLPHWVDEEKMKATNKTRRRQEGDLPQRDVQRLHPGSNNINSGIPTKGDYFNERRRSENKEIKNLFWKLLRKSCGPIGSV